jgi:16S rRNA (uracil1498-N3)-methyltransferase
VLSRTENGFAWWFEGMVRRRFYAPVSAFERDRKSVILTGDEARHLRDVLRLKPGDEVYVFDGEGREVQCAIQTATRDTSQLEIIRDVEPARPESPLQLVLAVALLKSDKFDLVIQKTTELGVSQIVPLITKRADIRLRDESDSVKRISRWQRIAMEAAKQSGRAVVPDVRQPAAFASFATGNAGTNSVLFSERDGRSLATVKDELDADSPMFAVIGPEGGWEDEELSLALEHGWKIVTLGGRTLRAETAAVTATALLQHLFGDLA